VARELLYAPEAIADLEEIYRFIAEHSPLRAVAFVGHIRRRCRLLVDSPELGPTRPNLGKGVRIYPMRRRVVVAYVISTSTVEALRVFYGGRDYQALMARSKSS
jgi:toxin ParE1/3/4